MSYSNDYIERFTFPSANIGGAGSSALQFSGPKGMTGRILDYGLASVSVAFTAVTTPAKLQIGLNGGAANGLAEMTLDTTAIGADLRATKKSGTQITNPIIPEGAIATVTGVAATGGSPAGTGVPFVTVLWY